MAGSKLGAAMSAAALIVSACGTSSPPSAKPTSASPNSADRTSETTPQQPSSGRMVVHYGDATTPEAVRGRTLMENTHVMEGLAKDVNETLILPFDIPLVGSQCGEANDFWTTSAKQMILCYEDVDHSLQIFGDAHAPNPSETARRIVIGSFYHELGHMAIDLFELPATGREEDVADQMAAYNLLQPDAQGKFSPDDVAAAKDYATAFAIESKTQDAASKDVLADVHTPDEARSVNMACWIYGSNPAGSADLVAAGTLPQGRADGCQDEYNKLMRAWGKLLEGHWK